jgi:hypothetical protein
MIKIKFTEELRRVDDNVMNWIENYMEMEEKELVSKIFNNKIFLYFC